MVIIMTDSRSPHQTTPNLSRGAPPRSGIERRIKDALVSRSNHDTAICWIRSHIGIASNTAADDRASFESYLGQISGHQGIATEGGIRSLLCVTRKDARSYPSVYKRSLSAYIWLLTDRAPQRAWLHHVGKAESPSCPICNHPNEAGTYITFDCPMHNDIQHATG